MFDTHAHLNFEAFQKDYKEVIKKSFENGIEGIINIGTNFKNSKRAIEIAEEFAKGPTLGKVWAAIGFHPDHLDEIKIEDISKEVEKFRKLAEHPKVVAIGEMGLDNYYFRSGKFKDTEENRKKAEAVFRAFLNLAAEVKLPVIIHSREAEEKTLKIIQNTKNKTQKKNKEQNTKNKTQNLKGVIHCFSGSLDFARKVLDLGFFVGFTGIVTYPPSIHSGQANADELRKVVEETPLDRILIETDCPFLAPQAYRGQRCEPWHTKETAQKIAEIKELSLEEVAEKTTQNAENLFNIPDFMLFYSNSKSPKI